MIKTGIVDFTISDIKNELRKRIANFDKRMLAFELSNGIVYVRAGECDGTSADTGGKTLEKVIDELAPRVVGLIEVCKEKSR